MSAAKNAIDQKEYLKKYLSGDKKKKKKKDKKQKKEKKVKIIDDNVFASGDIKIDEELLLTGEEAPQIVGEIFEEQPAIPKVEKWRNIVIKDEPEVNDNKSQVTQDENLWGRKSHNTKIKDEFSPKRQKIKIEKDMYPNRKSEHGKSSDSDLSPPRRSRKGFRRDSDSDLSIPSRRRRRSNSQDSDLSLPRRRRRTSIKPNGNYSDSDSNLSPPRQKSGRLDKSSKDSTEMRRIQSPVFIGRSSPNTKNSNFDLLAKRKNPFKREIQSPRRFESHSPRNNINGGRRRERMQISPSQIKREKQTPCKSPPVRKSRWESQKERERTLSPPPTHKAKQTKTLDGKTAGLQKAQSLKAENEARRYEENRMFEEMSKDISGRDAEVAVRNSGRRGRRAREAQEEDPEERRCREEREQEKKEIYDRWGKGVKQVEDRRMQMQQEAYESSKPLARSRDDEDLDKYLREQERTDDPMLEYMREKKREQMKQLNIPVMPKYEGSYPENRYGIRPGYRWDGVDRSNGYENRWFEVRNEKKAKEEEAYKYSVEDM